jgi:hypothetical protein
MIPALRYHPAMLWERLPTFFIGDQESIDDFSIVANTSLNDLDDNEDSYLLVKMTQIPDFAIFYSLLGAKLRMLPVIIEIKPPKAADAVDLMHDCTVISTSQWCIYCTSKQMSLTVHHYALCPWSCAIQWCITSRSWNCCSYIVMHYTGTTDDEIYLLPFHLKNSDATLRYPWCISAVLRNTTLHICW